MHIALAIGLLVAAVDGRFSLSSHGHMWASDALTHSAQPMLTAPVEPQKQLENALSKVENMSKPSYAASQSSVSASKYPVIEAAHLHLKEVFGKQVDTFWMDWKIWVGLSFWFAIWTKWLMCGYSEVFWERAVFTFGINMVILHHLQYTETVQIGMIGICILLTAQSVFQNFIWFNSGMEGKMSPIALSPQDLDQNEVRVAAGGEDRSTEEFVCDTLYMDLSLPVEQIIVLFVAQLGVWWFYMTSILGNFDFSHVNYLFWLWSYLAMQMTMIFNRGADSVLGNAFPIHDVYRLVLTAGQVNYIIKGAAGDEKPVPFKLSKANIIFRGVIGFFVNSILREIMAYTIPLMLMGFSEPMDFVVYCVGVNFICTLDDMTERIFVIHKAPTTEE